MNKVILIGNLGADPDARHTPAGKAVTELRLATSDGRDDKTEWHRVVLWEKQAELAAKFLKKGAKVAVEGRIQTRDFEDKDGNKRYITEIVANRIEFLSKVADEGAADADSDPFGP